MQWPTGHPGGGAASRAPYLELPFQADGNSASELKRRFRLVSQAGVEPKSCSARKATRVESPGTGAPPPTCSADFTGVFERPSSRISRRSMRAGAARRSPTLKSSSRGVCTRTSARHGLGNRLRRVFSGSPTQLDHRQMLSAGDVTDVEREPFAGDTAFRPMRPARSRLDAWQSHSPAGRDLHRRPAVEMRVRSMLVVPDAEVTELSQHRAPGRRHDDQAKALLLHRSNESLDDGDAARFAQVAEYDTDTASPAPSAVGPALTGARSGRLKSNE